MAVAGGKQAYDSTNRYAHAANTGLATHYGWVESDSVHRFHGRCPLEYGVRGPFPFYSALPASSMPIKIPMIGSITDRAVASTLSCGNGTLRVMNIVTAKALPGFRLELHFDNGESGVADLSEFV